MLHSLISSVTVVAPEVLEEQVRRCGWTPGRRADASRDSALLESAGYRVSALVLAILEELGGKDILFRTAATGHFAGFNQWLGQEVPFSRIQNERIRFTGRLGACKRLRKYEAETVNRSFSIYTGDPVVRCGLSLRRTQSEDQDVTGKNILFADEEGRIFELKAFTAGPYLEGYRSVGDFLALKCLPLYQLDPKRVRDVVVELPETDEDDEQLMRVASMLGVMK